MLLVGEDEVVAVLEIKSNDSIAVGARGGWDAEQLANAEKQRHSRITSSGYCDRERKGGRRGKVRGTERES